MTNNDRTTDRAQRLQAVRSGSADDAVERRVPDSNPGGSVDESPSRSRQERRARSIADEIDIDRRGVGTVDRIGGLDVFLRGPGPSQFGREVREDFAAEADFVTSADVDPNVDAEAISAQPVVARDRRPTVAERARSQTAADAEFIESRDLQAEVGAAGVTALGVRDSRRDDIRQRTRQGLAEDDPFARPSDFDVAVSDRGIESAGLTDSGQRSVAARQFADETPVETFDPGSDIQATDGGFGLTSGAQREVAARQFEQEFEQFGRGELDPTTDVRPVDDGYGLAQEPAAEIAAADLDAQYEDIDITPEDISLEPTGDGGFEAVFETEVRR